MWRKTLKLKIEFPPQFFRHIKLLSADAELLQLRRLSGNKWQIMVHGRPQYATKHTDRLNSTQLDVELSTRSEREQLSPINERSDPVDSVCRSWRHKQKHDWLGCTLFNWVSWVKLSWVELCRYKRAFRQSWLYYDESSEPVVDLSNSESEFSISPQQ